MDITIHPHPLHGSLAAIPSKSQAHRLLICAALADGPTTIHCPATNQDMDATMDCLNALGAHISWKDGRYIILPLTGSPKAPVHLPCRESGSTLRFLLPVAAALGADATFCMEGRLPQRPLSPLWEELTRMGCALTRPTPDTLRCQGQLQSGTFAIAGNISSQYITGLLLALPLLPGPSRIQVTGTLESRPYVDMTRQALELFGIHTAQLAASGGQRLHTPGALAVEGDWSNGAFFLAANALGSQVALTGLSPESLQGDRAASTLLPQLAQRAMEIDAGNIPDLVPILAVAAGAKHGGVFTHIRRLRLKESDRVETVANLLRALGGRVETTEDTMTVHPTGYRGGVVDAAGDHRIAMAAAIGATASTGPVTILGAQCVSKSYPNFWADYRQLGGSYEQYLR